MIVVRIRWIDERTRCQCCCWWVGIVKKMRRRRRRRRWPAERYSLIYILYFSLSHTWQGRAHGMQPATLCCCYCCCCCCYVWLFLFCLSFSPLETGRSLVFPAIVEPLPARCFHRLSSFARPGERVVLKFLGRTKDGGYRK